MSYSPSCAHRRRKQVREALALQCSCETTCFQHGKRVTLAPLTHTYETAGSRGEGPWTNVDYIHALATCRVARSSLAETGLQHSTPPGLPPPLAQAPGVRDPPPAAAGVWVHPRRRFAGWLVLGLPAVSAARLFRALSYNYNALTQTRPGWMAASRSNVVHAPGPIGRSSAANLGRREPQGIVRMPPARRTTRERRPTPALSTRSHYAYETTHDRNPNGLPDIAPRRQRNICSTKG